MSSDRKEAWHDPETDQYHFRGSSFGGCMHGLVLALRGTVKRAPDMHLRARFAAGSQSEDRLKEEMVAAGLATLGPPAEGLPLGIIYDAHSHYTKQRQVRASFSVSKWHTGFAYHEGLLSLRSNMPEYRIPIYTVGCALDGWGLDPRAFALRCAMHPEVYDGDVVVATAVTGQLRPFILEHKSMNEDKKKEVDACCSKPGVLDPAKFAELYRGYGWQITGQALGVRAMCANIFSWDDGHCDPLDSVVPVVFFSVETLQQVNGSDYIPTGRHLYYMERPPWEGKDVAERLHEVVTLAATGKIPECDSEWGRCDWGPGPQPSRPTRPPVLDALEPEEAQEVEIPC